MLFPESTYIGKRIPKEGFYSKADLNATQKRAFVEDIESIIWRNLISENTLNVSKGEKVAQIDFIEIKLKRKEYNKSILEIIEKAIPRHLVFILTFNSSCKLCINYKEEYQKGNYKILESFTTDWLNESEAELIIQGHNLDRVYENFVYQIAKGRIEKNDGLELSEVIQQSQEVEKIKKRIADLEEKKRKEKQFNMQLRIANEIKRLRSKIEI
ncbi:hypothetical protein ING2E5B_0658 [Fermentimonas caenicola]|uniref:DUF4391 domain-containing protein n=1 Tax=Fermentimonas caenicola TaxID=1562970 RepID=A0A098BXP9_9BACT|nr:hypothetical protein ING2E5B_0658 [Fermentimonas caenicola]